MVTTTQPAGATTAGTARRTTTRVGLTLALVSAASFGLSGPLAKSLLETGWTPGAVVLARVGGAAVVLLVPLLVFLRRRGLPSARQSGRVVAYGIVAIALAQLCYFNAVAHLSVGVALLLEYLAPVLLIFWHWWRSGVRPTRGVLVGAGVAMLGMVGVLDLLTGLQLDGVGVLWGLGAALCLCTYFVLSDGSTGADATPPLVMTAVGTTVGALVIVAAGAVGVLPLTVTVRDTTLGGLPVAWWVPVLALVAVSAVFAYLTGIVAVRRLGASAASFVALTEVIFAVVFAALLLAQQPTLTQLAGGALVLTGIALVQRR